MYWEKRLNWIVRVLALPAAEQVRLVPDFASAPEDLAVEFEASLIGAEAAGERAASHPSLLALNAELDALSALQGAAHWGPDALKTSDGWARVRATALAAVKAMGWSEESPEADPNVLYVGPPRQGK